MADSFTGPTEMADSFTGLTEMADSFTGPTHFLPVIAKGPVSFL